MEEIFADTSYWLALFDLRDALHPAALRVEKILPAPFRLVTSEPVILEVLNSLSKEHWELKREAILYFQSLRMNALYVIVPLNEELIARTEKIYLRANDKYWSFTDSTSFAIMWERDILQSLTYDHHFEQAGFRALLREA